MTIPKDLAGRNGGRPFMLTRPCMRNGCKPEPALYAPRLCVPLRGLPELMPWKGLVGNVEVCVAHFRELTPFMFRTPELNAIVREQLRKVGVEPDWARAFLEPCHITSQEYLAFFKRKPGDRMLLQEFGRVS